MSARPTPANDDGRGDGAGGEPVRLARDQRREALLAAAVEIASSGDLEALSMEAVAERAGVSRPLVYKHFANRDELLGAVYRREASALHAELARQVLAADTLEEMFAALVHGALDAAATRGPLFAALRAAGAWSPEVRREQRVRDVDTSRLFASRATSELGVERRRATAATGMLLTLIDAVLTQWRAKPTKEHAALLEDTYLTIVRASLAELARG
ncbi:MAG TPA: helix-turn-helix domain-containing protein [Acidimicrobiales bacterium]|nr:helix-turn-helix domain-containing protein [Acidimicrobiales bacterium]